MMVHNHFMSSGAVGQRISSVGCPDYTQELRIVWKSFKEGPPEAAPVVAVMGGGAINTNYVIHIPTDCWRKLREAFYAEVKMVVWKGLAAANNMVLVRVTVSAESISSKGCDVLKVEHVIFETIRAWSKHDKYGTTIQDVVVISPIE